MKMAAQGPQLPPWATQLGATPDGMRSFQRRQASGGGGQIPRQLGAPDMQSRTPLGGSQRIGLDAQGNFPTNPDGTMVSDTGTRGDRELWGPRGAVTPNAPNENAGFKNGLNRGMQKRMESGKGLPPGQMRRSDAQLQAGLDGGAISVADAVHDIDARRPRPLDPREDGAPRPMGSVTKYQDAVAARPRDPRSGDGRATQIAPLPPSGPTLFGEDAPPVLGNSRPSYLTPANWGGTGPVGGAPMMPPGGWPTQPPGGFEPNIYNGVNPYDQNPTPYISPGMQIGPAVGPDVQSMNGGGFQGDPDGNPMVAGNREAIAAALRERMRQQQLMA